MIMNMIIITIMITFTKYSYWLVITISRSISIIVSITISSNILAITNEKWPQLSSYFDYISLLDYP